MSDTKNDTPRIYVACLSSYNNGELYGRWIDADQDADTIREEIAEMLADSPESIAEEYAIHDYENFGPLRLGEFEDIELVADLGALIKKYGLAFAAYANNVGIDHVSEGGFAEAYCGEWGSEREYAEDLFDDLYSHEIFDYLLRYIDYEAFTRDLFFSECYSIKSKSGDTVYVFRNY